MPRKPHLMWRQAVEQYACPACGAAPGKPCVSIYGTNRNEPHADRSRLASAHQWNADITAEAEPDGQ